MVFSSLTFLLLFLPVVLLVYFAVPRQGKNAVLFLFSLLFYAWGEPIYVCLMIFSTILDYTCGRLVEKYRGTSKQKIGLIISICVNLGLLFFFKYTDFFIGTVNGVFGTSIPQLNLPLPIGISFYTFQTMSYTIDVYRGNAKMQKNIISFGAYVSLFPQLIAGPIVRYNTVAQEISNRRVTSRDLADGVYRFMIGLGKKVILANQLSEISDQFLAGGLHLERGQARALQQRTGLVAEYVQVVPAVLEGNVDRRQRGAVLRGREGAGIAVREDAVAVAQQLEAVLADVPADRDILLTDRVRLFLQALLHLRYGLSALLREKDLLHAVQRPGQVHRRGAGRVQVGLLLLKFRDELVHFVRLDLIRQQVNAVAGGHADRGRTAHPQRINGLPDVLRLREIQVLDLSGKQSLVEDDHLFFVLSQENGVQTQCVHVCLLF